MPSKSSARTRTKGGPKKTRAPRQPRESSTKPSCTAPGVDAVVEMLRGLGSARVRNDMGTRYGVTGGTARTAFGVGMGAMQKLAKEIRSKDPEQNHALALELWETGQYEARMVACLIDEPSLVTGAQMDRWTSDFDNWAICDTVCFKLFDGVDPALAFRKVRRWSSSNDEFVKRGAFALLASMALHAAPGDDGFVACLPLIGRAASDERNFVKKGVSWALRAVGRRGPELRSKAKELAVGLTASPHAAARWVGRDALRDLAK